MSELLLNESPPSTSEANTQDGRETLVSCVTNALGTKTQHYDVKVIIDCIRADKHFKLREPILKTRETFAKKFREVVESGGDAHEARKAAKDAVDRDKKRLPGVMWSATFRNRVSPASEKVLEHSGLLCADLDALGEQLPEIRKRLLRSPHLFAAFTSPTADGLKCVFRVAADVEKHYRSFLAVEKHVLDFCGVEIDEKCKDVGRVCFLSHDPDPYLNENAIELPAVIETTTASDLAKHFEPSDPQLAKRREIAEQLLGDIDWEKEAEGFCTCPGKHLHTTGEGSRDCRVTLDAVPTVYCFHNHCSGLVAGANRELRSRIGKVELAVVTEQDSLSPTQWFNQKFPTLASKFGDPIAIGDARTGPKYVRDISEDFIAATLGEESRPDTPTIFVPAEQKFYTYSPVEGIYVHQREPNLLTGLSRLLFECARDCQKCGIDTRALEFRLRDSKKLSGVLKKAQGILAAPDDFFSTGLTEFIPCENGMLQLGDKQLLPFSPTYRRRNKLAVPFDPEAKCSLFLETLMRPALDPDDLDLLQRWCGLALIGENLAQRLLILTGTAGGGKGTFVRVLLGIIGLPNVASLRTKLLGERFELGRFLGKTLLYGADVPEKFLNHRGASVLKSLTGGDAVTLEFKRSNESPFAVCKFNAIVTCNSRLTVHLEGDTAAWRRRLVIVSYDKPKPSNVIADLAERILANERSGVFNWMLDGLDKVRADGWQLHLTSTQQKTVDDLLLESESHIIFAREALCPADGEQLTVEDCYTAYVRFCTERGWITLPRNKFSNLIGDAVARMYGLPHRHDIAKDPYQPQQRGWRGLVVGSVLAGDLE